MISMTPFVKGDDFVKGYAMVYLSVAKCLNCDLRFQVGIDTRYAKFEILSYYEDAPQALQEVNFRVIIHCI